MKMKFMWFVLILTMVFVGIIKIYPNVKYIKQIKKECREQKVEIPIILAIVKIESNFSEKVVSQKGAIGLMQIMPTTAMWIVKYKEIKIGRYDLENYKDNIKIGVTYYKYLDEMFNGDLEKSLAGYNAGPSRAANGSWKKIGETRKYVKKVIFYKKIFNFFF
ncbi:MAG: hypothetical protein B6I28_03040 [Fusobacteriia bacterium 4572_132]|nr:MAG: hypothetical protein B6I28_03040 [Fusobacteriia bacterium 4572_132]